MLTLLKFIHWFHCPPRMLISHGWASSKWTISPQCQAYKMPCCLYCFFIILLCTRNLLSPVGWILHRPCEQYRYWQWIKESNIIIIEPDPPTGLSLSVARSANSPASREECYCNFSPVWAINISRAAASHVVIDAHIAVILVVFISFRLWLSASQSTPPPTFSAGGTCVPWRGRKMESFFVCFSLFWGVGWTYLNHHH